MIKLYFGDESGFSLTPCVPYGWIKKGEDAVFYLREALV
jgi:hypothetical protein